MILKTDNKYHHEVIQHLSQLKGKTPKELQTKENSLNLKCALLHASDLNNSAKETTQSV